MKKYKLPTYKEMCEEFDIHTSEAKSYILKAIMKKMVEKINIYTDFLDDI